MSTGMSAKMQVTDQGTDPDLPDGIWDEYPLDI